LTIRKDVEKMAALCWLFAISEHVLHAASSKI
jgi:hypothetical protein